MTQQASTVLCADDYAMSEAISSGIERLAGLRRLSATSAIVTGPLWPAHAKRIAKLRTQIAVGLHLSLTWGTPLTSGLTFSPLKPLILASLRGAIPIDDVRREFAAQLDAFKSSTGVLPDFIDGHEHVHILPGVREALFDVLGSDQPPVPWRVRCPVDRLQAIISRPATPKALIVRSLATGFRRRCLEAGFVINDSFAGFSAFDPEGNFETDLTRFFNGASSRHLVMCHPADPGLAPLEGDPIAGSRTAEFAAIARAQWLETAIWHRTSPNATFWSPAP